MKLNIIDIIEKNEFFLKKTFPEGLKNNQLGRLHLFFEDKIEFSLYTNQEAISPPKKWGKLGENYTTIVLKISGHFLKRIQINNWQNNKLENCEISIEKENDLFKILFSGKDWDVYIELENLIHQETSTYIDNKLV